MNAERLHALALAVKDDLQATRVVATMQQLRDALQNQVNAPQEPTYQQQVSTALQQLAESLAAASSKTFPPTWGQALVELGIEGLIGQPLADAVRDIFERNQITPSVAHQEIQALTERLEALATALDQLLAALSHLGVGSEDLETGEAEVGILIPRAVIDNELGQLGDEFVQLQKLLGPFLEIATGTRPAVEVRTISSTDFGVFLDIAPEAAAFLALAVERVVALYKSLLEIRTLRHGLRGQGLSDASLAGIDEHADEHMTAGIAAAVDELVDERSGIEAGRNNELKTELRLTLHAIANRIDKGYNIDVRAKAPEESAEDSESTSVDGLAQAFRTIAKVAPGLRFINRSGEPILSLPEAPQAPDYTSTD
ncbi:MAG: hypothetical protein M3P53_01825 [Actinomycetota bacterium]|nr:hypothetical protein [Actinomycetota bacterium]